VQADPIEQVLEYLADGQHTEALEQLDRLIREEPYHGTAHALRALIHANQGRLDRAADDAATAKELASDHPFVLYVAGAVALQQGAVLDAIRAAQEAQQLDPAYADAVLLEARARATAGQWARVTALADGVVEQEPENEEAAVLAALARSVERDGVLDDEAWKSLAERFPLNPVARAGSGWTRMHAGQIRAARAEFEQALALDPSLPWAKRGLALALKASNPVYALLLRFFLWFSRLPARTRTYVLIGGLLAYNFLRRTARAEPELKPFITPLLIAYAGFVVLSWLADPLLNLVLMARPEGRRLLTPDEKRGALLVGSCLTLAALLGGMAALTPWKSAGLSAFGVAFTSFAVSAAYQRKGRKRIQLQVLAGLALCSSLAAGILPQQLAGFGLVIAILCIVLGTWMSHFGEDRPRLSRADVS
jgi:tetratricopeptide (TPR) repeat protein